MPEHSRFLPRAGYDAVNAGERVGSIVRALKRAYGQPRTWLNYDTPFQLLIATIMSAQTTDDAVNGVTPELFERFPDAHALAGAHHATVQRIIRPTGFYRQKTKSIITTARALVERFDGQVPRTIEELTSLRGVARKTANVVLSNCWPRPASDHGIFVDTHIRRTSLRLALTDEWDPVKIERQLMELLPEKHWIDGPHGLIVLGRGPCDARNPDHAECPLLKWCPTGQEALGLAAPAKPARPPRRARRTRG